jgi:tetratricopeptide (TPR) repeat protein
MREKENERMDREAAEAYKPLPDDLKKEGAWRQTARKEGASATWARILRLSSFALAIAIFIGNAYAESGKNRAAIDTCKQAVITKPDDPEAHFNLGVAYGESGMYGEAIEAFKQAIRIKPNDADAHFNLGVACLKLNDRGSALEQYKILKDLDAEAANKLFDLIYK